MNRALTHIILAIVITLSAALARDALIRQRSTQFAAATQAVACGAPAPPIDPHAPPGSTWFSDRMPPQRFRGDTDARIKFVDPDQVAASRCGRGLPVAPCGMKWAACTSGHTITFPNPCSQPDDEYARLLCHEMAHVNGWPATHGE